MNPSDFPGWKKYPLVHARMLKHVDMQIDDVRAMLRLPLGELRAGCNFAATGTLANLISGFSIVLFKSNGSRGRRFKKLMKQHFPHDIVTEPPIDELVKVVYKNVRNPLSHSLGLREKAGKEPEINLVKRRVPPLKLEELETSSARPKWLGPTVEKTGFRKYRLDVRALYWGVFRLMESLSKDSPSLAWAEDELSKKKWVP